MSAFGKNAVFWVMNATGQWMHQLCIVNAMPNVYFHNWKEWVMQQTKYCNYVVMMLVSERKNKYKNK